MAGYSPQGHKELDTTEVTLYQLNCKILQIVTMINDVCNPWTLESPLDSKEIKPVNSKGNKPWIFIGRTEAAAEASILCPPNVKSRLTGKDLDAGKDWRQEEKWTEGEMVGWHHQLSGHELGQTLRDGEGQGSPECCSPWGCKELDTTEWLKTTTNP